MLTPGTHVRATETDYQKAPLASLHRKSNIATVNYSITHNSEHILQHRSFKYEYEKSERNGND